MEFWSDIVRGATVRVGTARDEVAVTPSGKLIEYTVIDIYIVHPDPIANVAVTVGFTDGL